MDYLRTSWEIWRSTRGRQEDPIKAQQRRLASLVAFAREHSPLYHRIYQGLPMDRSNLEQLPITTKPLLMGDFDEWATDHAIERSSIEAFLADKSQVGQPYLGRYAVWSTSGTTGSLGVFIHDAFAQRVYDTLVLARACPMWIAFGQLVTMLPARVSLRLCYRHGRSLCGRLQLGALAPRSREIRQPLADPFHFGSPARAGQTLERVSTSCTGQLSQRPNVACSRANRRQAGYPPSDDDDRRGMP